MKTNLTHNSLATLLGTNWINDDIINAYFKLLSQTPEHGRHKFHALSSFFFKNLEDGSMERVKRWSKDIDFKENQKIFMPINANGKK